MIDIHTYLISVGEVLKYRQNMLLLEIPINVRRLKLQVFYNNYDILEML